MLALSGSFVGGFTAPIWAQPPVSDPQPSLTETEQQSGQPVAPITDVQLQPMSTGLEILLETPAGAATLVQSYTSGRQWTAEITNAQLVLPEGNRFRQDNPTEQIESVTVTPLEGNRIQVVVTGTASTPTGQVFLRQGQGLVVNIQIPAATEPPPPQAEELETIELIVTAEREQEGYYIPEASIGTRTDTPIRDIPQSIQVVPQQLIEDRQVSEIEDILRTATGVTANFASRDVGQAFTIRGFSSPNFFINGIRDSFGVFETANLEQVEILRGPASVLFGQLPPGGVINLITKQPLDEPFYEISGTVGNFDFYRSTADLSGPLNADRSLLYRLNLAVQNSESFVDFVEEDNYLVAPVLTWRISDATTLTLEGEYFNEQNTFEPGLPAIGTILPNPNGNIARETFLGDPSSFFNFRGWRLGYSFEHQFNEDWQLRNTFRVLNIARDSSIAFPANLLEDNRTLERRGSRTLNPFIQSNLVLDTNVVGSFKTGAIQHQLLTGIDLYRQSTLFGGVEFLSFSPVDIFNLVHNQTSSTVTGGIFAEEEFINKGLGIYLQDQVSLAENLIILLGGRFDIVESQEFLDSDFISSQQDQAFSPRLGIVYRPVEPVSLYASYSRSFQQEVGTSVDGQLFEPTQGTQYEVGVKADLSDRLFATLAFFDLTRSNVVTSDPENPIFSIQTGEQQSRGIEFDLAGEILPGWDIAFGYAYTDAKVTKDNDIPEGNRLINVPEHSFSLWTKYEIQDGDFQGLGLGLGLFYVGEREGDLSNTFRLPSYLRTDAAIYYRRNGLRAQVNIENLFDIDYFEAARNRLRVFPGAPLTVRGTIGWTF